MAGHSMWIVEHARVVDSPLGAVLSSSCSEGRLVLPYRDGMGNGEGHIAVVDTGFDNAEYGKVRARMYGVRDWQPGHDD